MVRDVQRSDRERVRPQTLADYRKRLEQDAIPFLGRLRLSEVEPRDVKALAARVASRGVSPNTVRLALAPVRALFATAVEEGVIRSNPALGVRVGMANGVGHSDEEKAKALSPDELQALLAAIPEPERLFFRFLAQTGLRIGEAVPLRVGDVDLGRCRVQVRRRWYRDNFATPKSKHGRRDVPLAPSMAKALWPLIAGRDTEALLFRSEQQRVVDQSNLASRVLKPAARHRCPLVLVPHVQTHRCVDVLPGRMEREAGAARPRPPFASVHARDLCPPDPGRPSGCRLPRRRSARR